MERPSDGVPNPRRAETHCLLVWVSRFPRPQVTLAELCGNGDNATVCACELGMTAQGWKLSTAAKERQELFADDLRLANAHLGSHACVGARFGRATVAAQALSQIGFTHIVSFYGTDRTA